jgi:hypothetical protein
MFIIWQSLSFSRGSGLLMGVKGPMQSSQQFGFSPYPELDKTNNLCNLLILPRIVKCSPTTPFSVFFIVINNIRQGTLDTRPPSARYNTDKSLLWAIIKHFDSRVWMEEAVHTFQSLGNTTYSPHILFIVMSSSHLHFEIGSVTFLSDFPPKFYKNFLYHSVHYTTPRPSPLIWHLTSSSSSSSVYVCVCVCVCVWWFAQRRWYENDWIWNTGGIILKGYNQVPCPSHILSNANVTWIRLGSNPDLQSKRPAIKRLSHGTNPHC